MTEIKQLLDSVQKEAQSILAAISSTSGTPSGPTVTAILMGCHAAERALADVVVRIERDRVATSGSYRI
jgi:hypothetical protein